MRYQAIAAVVLWLSACLPPPSTSQRLTDAVLEMNTATRFGRMDVAFERVSAQARNTFMKHRAAWGGDVRIVDIEFNGFNMLKSDEAEVYILVSWIRSDEPTVQSTALTQRWHDDRGQWQLTQETRKDGDTGLLGERPSAVPAADGSHKPLRAGVARTVITEE